jgi:acetyl-CoA synthetase
VAEALAVGKPDEIKGESIVLCIVAKDDTSPERLGSELIQRVEKAIGAFARPAEVKIVAELPKTRTGKLLRRLVRAKVSGENIGANEISSAENPACLDDF